MFDDQEMKEDFLQPLKMQGVFDITDNALIVRFKFTVKPNRPTFIQREALKRMFRTLPGQGISFATGAVSVQALGAGVDPTLAAAAASQQQAMLDAATAAAAS